MKNFVNEENDYKKSDLVIFPASYENDVSWIGGTKKGPQAIIDASIELEYYSTYLKARIVDSVRIHTSKDLGVLNKPYESMIQIVESNVLKSIENGKKFALLGGDHSITNGAINAISKKYKDFSILYIDAHGDLRDQYKGSKFNHACVLRRALEKTKNIVSVGVRSYSIEEAEFIKKEKLDIFGTDFDSDKISKKLGKNLYISIDLDAFDPSEVPGVGTPQPGGLKWNDIISLIEKISKNRNIIGFDVVELAPLKESKISDFLASKLTYNLIGYSFYERFK